MHDSLLDVADQRPYLCGRDVLSVVTHVGDGLCILIHTAEQMLDGLLMERRGLHLVKPTLVVLRLVSKALVVLPPCGGGDLREALLEVLLLGESGFVVPHVSAC